MSGRIPAIEDCAAIAARLRELQAERTAPQPEGNVARALVLAMQRLRTRRKRRPMTADEIIAEGIAQKYARHRGYTPAGPPGDDFDTAIDRAIAAADRALAAGQRYVEEIERAITAEAARGLPRSRR